jgi:elongation factor G
VIIQLTPAERGAGITFASKVVGGNVPKEYIPAVEKGIRKAAAEGVIAGYPVVDVHVTLTDGSSHSVDSSGMAFEIAGSMAFKQGVKDASPQLLEPMLDLKVVVPEENAGAVMSDLNGRRARIMNMDASGGFCRIDAQGSAAKMQRYATELRSLTQARGEFTAAFAHYEPVPPDYNIEQRETIGAGSA